MITGQVSDEGVPLIALHAAGREWEAVIDTGFNGDLELPAGLQGQFNDQPAGRLRSALAGGQVIEEDAFAVEFSFDGEIYQAIATFAPESQILIGTHLLRDHCLQIWFAEKVIQLERES